MCERAEHQGGTQRDQQGQPKAGHGMNRQSAARSVVGGMGRSYRRASSKRLNWPGDAPQRGIGVRRQSRTNGAKVEAAQCVASCSCAESEVTDRDHTPESITQQTTIAEADRILRMEPVVVDAGASLRETAERAVENTGCRVIAVVEPGGRLAGVLPVRRLVNDIFLKIVPEEFLGDITDLDAALKYAEALRARTAGDVMLDPVSVHPDETVRTAFERMHNSRLNGLPITDRDERVVGYVDQLELLMVWIQATGRASLLEPEADGGASGGDGP